MARRAKEKAVADAHHMVETVLDWYKHDIDDEGRYEVWVGDTLAGFTEFSVDRAVATMPVEGNTQPAMLLHGGAYVVLGESLGSMSANLWAAAVRLV